MSVTSQDTNRDCFGLFLDQPSAATSKTPADFNFLVFVFFWGPQFCPLLACPPPPRPRYGLLLRRWRSWGVCVCDRGTCEVPHTRLTFRYGGRLERDLDQVPATTPKQADHTQTHTHTHALHHAFVPRGMPFFFFWPHPRPMSLPMSRNLPLTAAVCSRCPLHEARRTIHRLSVTVTHALTLCLPCSARCWQCGGFISDHHHLIILRRRAPARPLTHHGAAARPFGGRRWYG